MADLPTTYDSGVTSSASGNGGSADTQFVKSLKGILRLVEMIVSLVGFICVAVGQKHAKGAAGWCMFVTMFSFLVLITTYFLWLFGVLSKPGRAPVRFMEYVMYITWDVLYFIAACVASAFGGAHSGMGAGAFFIWAMLIVCAVDTFFHYRYWQSSDEGPYICGHQVGGQGGSSGGGQSATGPPSGENRAPTY